MRRGSVNERVPEGWKNELLDKITNRASGHTPSKSIPAYWDGGIKWVSLADSSRLDKLFINETCKAISEDGIKNSSAVLLPKGTVILSRDAGVGKSAILQDDMAISQHFIAWDCSSKKNIYNIFLYYWLQSKKPLFETQAVGSTIKTIGLPFFKKLKITYPQFFEQQKIAHILTTWDAAITCTQKLLENSKQQKKALMQQLLTGRRRLPGFSKNWQKIKLGKLFSRVTTRNSEKCTTVVTISAQQGLIRQEDFFSKAVASSTLDNYFLIKNGEFAYNKSYSKGYPFGAIKRLNKYELGVVTSLYICFSLHDSSQGDKDFFEHFFEYGSLNSALEKIAHEGGRAHGLLNVKPEDFFAIHMTVPPLNEQKAIAEVLTAADALIAQYEARLDHLQMQKKALMQQLLTGKIRVMPDTLGNAGATPA